MFSSLNPLTTGGSYYLLIDISDIYSFAIVIEGFKIKLFYMIRRICYG